MTKRTTAAQVDSIAAEAVRIAGVASKFRDDVTAETVFAQIEKCDTFVDEEQLDDPDDSFLLMALPIANGLIHHATSRRKLDEAQEWVKKNWYGDVEMADPVSILGVLTLIYIVNEGFKHYRGQAREKKWLRIRDRLERLKDRREVAA